MAYANGISVDVTELTEKNIRFTVQGLRLSDANKMKVTFIEETPTLAIDKIKIEKNSSTLSNNWLNVRFGRIRLISDEVVDSLLFARECTCENFCAKCCVTFTLDVKCTGDETRVVTLDDLISSDPRVIPVTSELPDDDSGEHGPMFIVTLQKGQELKLIAYATKGIGRQNEKWRPTAGVSLEYDPAINLRLNYLPEPDDNVDEFRFNVISVGSLKPENILLMGLGILKNRYG